MDLEKKEREVEVKQITVKFTIVGYYYQVSEEYVVEVIIEEQVFDIAGIKGLAKNLII
jgi:hypothetical protein